MFGDVSFSATDRVRLPVRPPVRLSVVYPPRRAASAGEAFARRSFVVASSSSSVFERAAIFSRGGPGLSKMLPATETHSRRRHK